MMTAQQQLDFLQALEQPCSCADGTFPPDDCEHCRGLRRVPTPFGENILIFVAQHMQIKGGFKDPEIVKAALEEFVKDMTSIATPEKMRAYLKEIGVPVGATESALREYGHKPPEE